MGQHRDPNIKRAWREAEVAALPSRPEGRAWPDDLSRRDMIRLLMGASSALALGLTGCERKPKRQIISRVAGPEYQTPGQALYYASTWIEGPYPYGLMIKTVDGRPIKIEGNPDHPVNRGTSSAAMQASVLSLYDPDRLRRPEDGAGPTSWETVDRRVVEALRAASSVILMTRANLGPAMCALIRKFGEVCPQARHFVHEAVHDGRRRSAWQAMFGAPGEALPRFDQARVILSLDSDFLGTDGAVLENIRCFTEGRQLVDSRHQGAEISRLYVVEPAMSVTGSNADHRVALRPSAIGPLARGILKPLGGDWGEIGALCRTHDIDELVLRTLIEDLKGNTANALVVAGPHLPQEVHGAAALLNDALNAPGHTLAWNPVPPTQPVNDPEEVEAAFEHGVDVAIFLDTNPVYDWPGGGFVPFLKMARLSVGHGLHRDETLAACSLALPSSHNLESWGDAEPRAGIKSLCQPVIAPLFESRQPAESIFLWTKALAAEQDPLRACEDWYAFLQRRWVHELATAEGGAGPQPQRLWEEALRRGGVFRASEIPFPRLNRGAAEDLLRGGRPAGKHEVIIYPHHAVYDGRFANNSWLQELPDPASKLVWENAACVSPATATSLEVAEGDAVVIQVASRAVELPVLVQSGMADGVVATSLGYGRKAGGQVAQLAGGVNVALLLGQEDPLVPCLISDARVAKTGGSRRLARTQEHFSMEGRPIVLHGTLQEYRKDAGFVERKRHVPEPVSMYPSYDYSKGHKWAMAIDLGACVGCNACVTACQAENNIPVVGREQCAKGREMHWIRIDRYLTHDGAESLVHQQPMLCQHCDNAPCEGVCPVNATTHSPEGLNEVAYNRCVGTRYCANNCPYKVRRFNFLRYQEAQLRDPVQELVFNPQVTVRGVGVIEKCTFCVQRITEGKFASRQRGRPLQDGEIRTACQQACPAQAITFGDLNDPESGVARMHASKRAFFVLEEYNVRPNIAYLARVRNRSSSTSGNADGSGHG